MIVMIIIYGVILGFAAKLISDGSEELLELFPSYSAPSLCLFIFFFLIH